MSLGSQNLFFFSDLPLSPQPAQKANKKVSSPAKKPKSPPVKKPRKLSRKSFKFAQLLQTDKYAHLARPILAKPIEVSVKNSCESPTLPKLKIPFV